MGKSCVATKRYSGTIPKGRYHTHRMTPVSTCQPEVKLEYQIEQFDRAADPALEYHCLIKAVFEENNRKCVKKKHP